MALVPTPKPSLRARLERWVGAKDVATLSTSEVSAAAKDLQVPLDELMALRAALVDDASDAAFSAGEQTARDRDASEGAAPGFGGSSAVGSPAFSRFNAPKKLSLIPSFRRPTLSTVKDLDIDAVAGVAVKRASLAKFEGMNNDFLHADALTTVQLTFGKLARLEFDKLHAAFGGMSQVSFDAEREYDVVDFLPRALQALVNTDLQVPDPVEIPGSAKLNDPDGMVLPDGDTKRVDLTANCHGTAWGAMRAYQDGGLSSVEIFLGDANNMDGQFYGEALEKRDSFDTAPVDALKNADLKPGDLVAFYAPGGFNLLHTAVYVGGDLFFEKPDTESRDGDAPYRLGTADTISAPVIDFGGDEVEIVIGRPKSKLPPGKEAFKSMMADQAQAFAKVQGAPLDFHLVDSLEMSMGGGILGAYMSGAVDVALSSDARGRGALG